MLLRCCAVFKKYILIRWELRKEQNKGEGKSKAVTLKVVPAQVALVTGVPCTLLRMDSVGEFIAVGASDGAVTVFNSSDLSRVSAAAGGGCITAFQSFLFLKLFLVCALMQ